MARPEDIRKILLPVLGLVAVGNGAVFAILAVTGFLWRILKDRRIVAPALLFAISGGGIGVFGLMFGQREIHEDVLWIRTVELVLPILTASYAVWCIVTELRHR